MYSEILAIQKIKDSNDNDALKDLVEMHSGLCNKISNTYQSYTKGIFNSADLFNERFNIVYNAARKYNPEKSKFSTHLFREYRWYALGQLKNFVHEKEINYEPAPMAEFVEDTGSALFNFNELDKNKINSLVSKLDKRTKKIFDLKYSSGKLSYRDIGAKVGLSYQAVKNIHDNTIKKLQKNLIK